MTKRLLFFVPPSLYMGLIFCLSSRPAPEFFQGWPLYWGMKSVHLCEYGFLALLWIVALLRGTTLPLRDAYALSVVVTFLWGVSDEWHQAFVPGRSARLEDVLTDLSAALLCVAGCAIIRWPRRPGQTAPSKLG